MTISKASMSMVSTGQMVHTEVSDNVNTNIKNENVLGKKRIRLHLKNEQRYIHTFRMH